MTKELQNLGFDEWFVNQLQSIENHDFRPARIVQVNKDNYLIRNEKKEIKETEKVENKVEDEVEPSLAVREKVVSLIEKEDEVEEEKLIQDLGLSEETVKKAIQELLKEGEVYMPRPGYLKMV